MSRREYIPQRRKTDAKELRMSAEDKLRTEVLSAEDCANMACVSERTWKRYEAGEKIPPDSVIKIFCYDVAMRRLEACDTDDEVLILLGYEGDARPDSIVSAINDVFEYVDNYWKEHDPARKD
jgi:hypothetical protein